MISEKGKECVSKFRSVSEIGRNFAECQRKTLGKEVILPSVCQMTLDKEIILASVIRRHSAKVTIINYRRLMTVLYRGSRFAECLALNKAFFVERLSMPSVFLSRVFHTR